MKTYFRRISCPSCGRYNDIKRGECAHCHGDLNNPDAAKFAHHLHFPFWKEAIFLVLALVGLTVIATVVQMIQMVQVTRSLGPEATREQIIATLSEPSYLSLTDFLAYGLIFISICILIWKGWRDVGRSFKGWKPYVFGIAGFAAIILFEIVYGFVLDGAAKALGVEAGSNTNQNTLVSMISFAPVASLLIFGVIGPFVEEFAYRVGLFGLASRLGKPLGYIFTILVFALIHFDYSAAFDFANNYQLAVLEWLNLPIYMFSGAAFTLLYDKVGFSCSFFAHTLNNVFSIGVNILGSSLQQ